MPNPIKSLCPELKFSNTKKTPSRISRRSLKELPQEPPVTEQFPPHLVKLRLRGAELWPKNLHEGISLSICQVGSKNKGLHTTR